MKVLVYTVLVGDKEALNDPLRCLAPDSGTDLELEFVCITDNPALTSPTWTFRDMPDRLIPPEKLSRLPKALPHRMFPDCDYSLYIDNTVIFKRLPNSSDLAIETGAVFRAFRHPWRACPQDEADVVVRSGLDDAETVAAQTRFYDQKQPLHTIPVLTAGTALLRRHSDPRVQMFGEFWWEQILLFSARDQISLDQCARAAGCPIHHFPGDKTNSDLIAWPALAASRRVEATFDAERYAWEKRHDPIARVRPKVHYLLAGDPVDYTRHPAWFRYCCLRVGSGFGQQGAPRRGLADLLEPLLRDLTGNPGGILLVGLASDKGYAAVPEELVSAQEALALYFRFSPLPTFATSVPEQELADPAPFRAAFGVTGFRLVIAFGLSPAQHINALTKFLPLLAPDGTLVVQFGEGLSTAEMARMEQAVEEPCTVSVFHGGHIAQADPISSSVFVVRRAVAVPPVN